MKKNLLIAALAATTAYSVYGFLDRGGRVMELERNLSWYLRSDQDPLEARWGLLTALERPYKEQSREGRPSWFREDPRLWRTGWKKKT